MLLPLATAARGQQTPSSLPSVASYLCTFAGKCGGDADAAEPTRDAPETKGFRLARPAGAQVAQGDARPASVMNTSVSPRHTVRHAVRASALLAADTAVASTASLVGRRADLMVAFDLDSARLSNQGRTSARIFAQSLLTPELSGKRFLIQGHTDTLGGHDYNMVLSARRARAVADFLVGEGVDRARLEMRGYGPDVPLSGHASSDPANRRVEAELLS
jgi:outer membrane protein OmpA-like peptidoglycan-associated protein